MTRVILDTDIGTDADDALALGLALRHPRIDLRAVTTVSGDTVRRARIAKKLLLIAGRDDIEVAAGERGEVSQANRSPEGGHEGEGLLEPFDDLLLSERDGVSLLLEECAAHGYEVATVGMQSNIAAALERDPSFVHEVPRLAVMGGVFAPVQQLSSLFDSYQQARAAMVKLRGVLSLCAVLHGEWARIHPFANGNGRTARLWANWGALRYGLPPFVTVKPRPGEPYGLAAMASMSGNHAATIAAFHEMLRIHLSRD